MWLQDPHQRVHDLRGREELARLRTGVVGELLDEVLVGPAQHIGRHGAVRQIVLIKVLDQRMDDFMAISGLPDPSGAGWFQSTVNTPRSSLLASATARIARVRASPMFTETALTSPHREPSRMA